MEEVISVRVNLGLGCEIKIGSGLLNRAGEEFANLFGPCMVTLLTDLNVGPLYRDACLRSLADAGFKGISFNIPAGEESKKIVSFAALLETMAKERMTGFDCVAALGGGMVGDLGGFVAGCYMHGIKFVYIPTSLIACVDSAVGGRNNINLNKGRNLAGMFWQPALVLCDIDCFKTLPEEEFDCGLAEALKVGVLAGGELFNLFSTGYARENIIDVIAGCVRYKAGVVEEDERGVGKGRLLSLGHTVGEAIEICSDYKTPHGFAVAAGLGVMARASAAHGWCSRETADAIEDALNQTGLPSNTDFPAGDLAKAALSVAEREGKGDVITIAVPCEIGGCMLKVLLARELEQVISDGL